MEIHGLINSELNLYRVLLKKKLEILQINIFNQTRELIVDYLPGDETNKTTIE